jgi:acyl carrier protein
LPGPSPTADPTSTHPAHDPAPPDGAEPAEPAEPADLDAARRGAVLAGVRDLLGEVIGPEYMVELTIAPSTSLERDLQLESLDLVVLGDLLPQRFGDEVDLVAWLATKELDEIVDLTVGDLVDLVMEATVPGGTPRPTTPGAVASPAPRAPAG